MHTYEFYINIFMQFLNIFCSNNKIYLSCEFKLLYSYCLDYFFYLSSWKLLSLFFLISWSNVLQGYFLYFLQSYFLQCIVPHLLNFTWIHPYYYYFSFLGILNDALGAQFILLAVTIFCGMEKEEQRATISPP